MKKEFKVRWYLWVLLGVAVAVAIYILNLVDPRYFFFITARQQPVVLNTQAITGQDEAVELDPPPSCAVLPKGTYAQPVSVSGMRDGSDYRVNIVPYVSGDQSEFADFPLYYNAKYGFEFRYDPAYEIIEKADSSQIILALKDGGCPEGCSVVVSLIPAGTMTLSSVRQEWFEYMRQFRVQDFLENVPGMDQIAAQDLSAEAKAKAIAEHILPGRCSIGEVTIAGMPAVFIDSKFGGIVGYVETYLWAGNYVVHFANTSLHAPQVETFRLR